MADYIDLFPLQSNTDLLNKVSIAVRKAARNLLESSPTANNQKFAKDVFQNPKHWAKITLSSVIVSNSGSTVAQITGASDSLIQTEVDAIVPSLVVAFNS